MDEIDVAVAAGLITFSGIAATWAVQLTSAPAKTGEELYRMVTLAICAVLFGAATVLALLFLLFGACRTLLIGSTVLALISMFVLLVFVCWVFPRGLRRSRRIVRNGPPALDDIDREARTLP